MSLEPKEYEKAVGNRREGLRTYCREEDRLHVILESWNEHEFLDLRPRDFQLSVSRACFYHENANSLGGTGPVYERIYFEMSVVTASGVPLSEARGEECYAVLCLYGVRKETESETRIREYQESKEAKKKASKRYALYQELKKEFEPA